MLYVITGPPCVGKSTYVRQRARPGEVVVDLDRIALSIVAESTPPHHYPGHVRRAAMTMRKTAVRAALEACRAADAYIIHAKPSRQARGLYAAHGAEFVELTETRDVLLARARAERPPHIQQLLERWATDPTEYM